MPSVPNVSAGCSMHREERIEARRVLDVVEADERHVVGNLETRAARTASIAPRATRLLTVKTAVGRLVELEQPPHALVRRRPGRRSPRRRAPGRPGCPQRPEPPRSLAAGRARSRPRPTRRSGRCGGGRARSGARRAAARRRRCRRATASESMPGNGAVDEHERHPELRSRRRCVAERSLTGAITIPSTRWAIISSITSRSTRQIRAGVAEDHPVARRAARRPRRRGRSG